MFHTLKSSNNFLSDFEDESEWTDLFFYKVSWSGEVNSQNFALIAYRGNHRVGPSLNMTIKIIQENIVFIKMAVSPDKSAFM